MSPTLTRNAWLFFSIVLVSLASAGAVHAATETVTLKNGKTYEVKTNRRGEPVAAKNRQVEMTLIAITAHASPSSDTPVYVWEWNARLKRRGPFKVTVTTPIDETVSASFVVMRGEIGNKFFFDSEEYPTLWAWLDEPETSWIPFVFSFEDTQSDNTFALTQWGKFSALEKKEFVRVAYLAAEATAESDSGHAFTTTETVTPPFDDRDWELGYRWTKGNQVVLEYVLSGETVENWSELITVHSFVGAQETMTPRDHLSLLQQHLLENCPNAMWNVIRQSDNDIVVEWRTEGCVAPYPLADDQYEITRALSGSRALHRVAYTTKRQPHLPETERSEWIDRIDRAEVQLPEQTSNSGTETTHDDPEGSAGVQGAVGSTYSEVTSELLPEPPQSVSGNDTALIYIFWEHFGELDVFMDEIPIASLPRHSYTTVVASPGWHLMWGGGDDAEWFEFKAGREYLLRRNNGWMIGDPEYIARGISALGLALVVPTEDSLG